MAKNKPKTIDEKWEEDSKEGVRTYEDPERKDEKPLEIIDLTK
jgi:hypothetical protein